MSNCLFITGTDTNAGKTVLTSALAAYWQAFCADRRLGIMKPIQSGVGDREFYLRLFSLNQSAEELNPLYFQAPLAPPIAAQREGATVDLGRVWPVLQGLRQRCDLLLVEALGGLGSPVTEELTVADLARDWRLPSVLVVPVRLGAISQAVANVALARQAGVVLKGIIFNCPENISESEIEDLAPRYLVESLTQVPVLGCLPFLADISDKASLIKVASELDLERLLPVPVVVSQPVG